MNKIKYQIQFGHTDSIEEAINPEEAFIIAVRKSKLADMSILFRFRKVNGKYKETRWNYQNPIPILEKYNFLKKSSQSPSLVRE